MLGAMDDNGGTRITGIKQIIKLKELIQRWQHATLGPRNSNSPRSDEVCGGISPEISWRLRNSSVRCDSDEDSCHSLEMPSDVPRGYLAVYVGPELRRFIIPTSYLSDPLFKVLLEKVEEEFGFDHSGGLTIPCDIETFKYLLQCMENHRKEQADQGTAG
ncbi:UNVERIFIED_CONTAM: Indole-3-acetic acid-induced protein ARG7 [Sesamum radiatum]|uniref:Indole-3-acetic acid-induced protein ARG7 n=1 Tax=Sesamum radiatum TaxID=300843 RepID=A0AAW2NR64_SESRA